MLLQIPSTANAVPANAVPANAVPANAQPPKLPVKIKNSPSRSEFAALAKQYQLLPVWRELSADTLTPVAAFMRVVGNENGFLLESVEGGERWSRFSFIGRRPVACLSSKDGRVSLSGQLPCDVPLQEGVLASIEAILGALKSPNLAGLPPLHGGLVGYLGYDVVREVEKLPHAPTDDRGIPDCSLAVIGQLVAFDHWRQSVVLVDNVVVEPHWSEQELQAAWSQAIGRLDELQADLSHNPNQHGDALVAVPERGNPFANGEIQVTRTLNSNEYQSAVNAAKEHILAGDIFQVVLSQRFDVELKAPPFDCYRVLRQINPSPYMYFIRQSEVTLVGSSPEPMVRLQQGRVISRPIAGTRRRGESESEDRLLAAELAEDPKERAEHVMLVDLARNDVGRVAKFGTQTVDEFMSLERFSHVMHLTSEVSGDLKEGLGPIDVLRATMPAGTVSGAPKVRAMQIIDDLEPCRRGPYAGVVGYFDFSGNMDVAIAIRTMVVGPHNRAWVQAGAGIVADSDPDAEDRECWNKALAVLATIKPAEEIAQTGERTNLADMAVQARQARQANQAGRIGHAEQHDLQSPAPEQTDLPFFQSERSQ